MSGNGEVEKVEVGETSRGTVEDKIFVAVDEEHGRSTLLWALQHLAKDGATIMIARVHRPAIRIPAVGNQQVVDAKRKKKLAKANKKLDEYATICRIRKVSSKKLTIENDDVAKGLEELIVSHGITKLVMGAAADEHYSNCLYSLSNSWSKKALILMTVASKSCKIWFTCKGHLICTREGETNVFATPPSPTEEALYKAEHDLLSTEEALHKAKRDLLSTEEALHGAKQDLLYAQEEMDECKRMHQQESGLLVLTQVLCKKRAEQAVELKAELESARNTHKEELAKNQRYIEILEAKLENLLSEADDPSVKVSAPSYFICSITQDVMKDPHIVEDGTSYEGKDIRKWLEDGNHTLPMTNLRLTHNVLTPNTALCLAIEDWQKQRRQQARSGGGSAGDDHSANAP